MDGAEHEGNITDKTGDHHSEDSDDKGSEPVDGSLHALGTARLQSVCRFFDDGKGIKGGLIIDLDDGVDLRRAVPCLPHLLGDLDGFCILGGYVPDCLDGLTIFGGEGLILEGIQGLFHLAIIFLEPGHIF